MRTLSVLVLVALVGVLGRYASATAQINCVCDGTPLQPNEACCFSESPAKPYSTETHCCTEFGIQQQYPITDRDLSACPNRVQNPDKDAIDNGICDPRPLPDTLSLFGRTADFRQCCIAHDHCYSTCKHPEQLTDHQYRVSVCDNELRQCWERECLATFSGGGLRNSVARTVCLSWAGAQIRVLARLPAFVTRYFEGQRYACMCCVGDQPEECPECGNNTVEGSEQCDGTDDGGCPDQCIPAAQPNECQCPLETVTVPSTGTTVYSTNLLQSGKSYLLVASGTYVYWPSNPAGLYDAIANPGGAGIADAEYALRPPASSTPYAYNPYPYSAWIYGEDAYPPGLEAALDIVVDGNDVYWGSANPNHNYYYIYVGTGAAASFRIFDDFYGDNSGSLTVKIYPPVDSQ